MAQYLAPGLLQVENSSGVPLNGAKLHVYQTGTTTHLSLFAEEALSTPLSNPLVADASGAFPAAFLAETKYKILLTTSADVTVWTRDVVYSVGVTNTIAADDVSYDNGTSGLAAETLQEAIDEVVDLQGTSQSWTSSADGPIATGTSTNTGAAAGPLFEAYRNSASPANSDVIGGLRLTGKNASASKTTFAQVHGVITDTTNASEDAKIVVQTIVAGALADRVHIGGGVWGDGATGGDPGTGKANFTEVRLNGAAISPAKCWAYVTVSAGTPTLQTSHNITSITDTGAGTLTVTIATDFSSANWAPMVSINNADGTTQTMSYSSVAAGSIVLNNLKSGTGAFDPGSWAFAGFGALV